MKEDQKTKRLRLWKARQEAEGHDVSGVTTLEQAEHFFDKKDTPEATKESAADKVPEKPKKNAKKPKEV